MKLKSNFPQLSQMNLATKDISILQEEFILTNQRALFWESESALVISDLHIGKTAHFRKNGIAVPKDILEKDLLRLEKLIKHFSAKKIIINGDLLHAGDNSDVDFFCEWRNHFSETEFHLVKGNHDQISKNLEEKLCLTSKQNILEIGDFAFTHDFNSDLNKFQITGHVHPGMVMRTKIKNIKLPCFAVAENQLLLPAFSEFTGLDIKNIPQKGTFFAFTKKEIYEV